LRHRRRAGLLLRLGDRLLGGLGLSGRRGVAGWPSGSSIDSQDTLAFAALQGIRPRVETYPLDRAGDAYERMMSGKARFRVVLTT